jgi:hypothetical protein
MGTTISTTVSGISVFDATVVAGGVAIGVAVGMDGLLAIDSGGIVISPSVWASYYPASVVVSSGGVLSGGATNVTVEPGGSLAPGAGSLIALTVVSGATADVTGGLVVGNAGIQGPYGAIESGGVLLIGNGGSADNIAGGAGGTVEIASGGVEDVFGSGVRVTGLTVLAGGTVTVADVASVGDMAVSAGGVIVVGGLGTAGPMALSAGTLEVSGGSAISAIADAGALIVVSSGGTAITDGVSGGRLVLQAGAEATGGLVFEPYGYGGDIVIGGTTLPTVPISGLGGDDTIELPNIPYDPHGSISIVGNTLDFSENGYAYSLTLSSAGLAGRVVTLASDGAGTMIDVACFAAGTRIATPSGAAPVEALRPGDVVLALEDGAWRPARVRWVGCTMVDLARHPRPQQAAPIRIRAHAFADAVPHRDLFVSPDHAIFVDGVLMQAQSLRNGATVVQEFPPRVTYWHVELDRHAVLCAEGLAAESYLDTGNRALFAGEAGARPLHPDMAAAAWNELACAQLHLAGPLVAAAHARLLLRAVALGWNVAADPALRIVADDREVLAFAGGAGAWHATLPAGTRAVRLLSRRFVPAWFAEDDRRQLGVAVRALRLGGRRLPRTAFGAGWHAQEREWRWTDGDATLTLQPLPRPARLSLTAADAGARYWLGVPASALSTAGARGIGATAP